MVQAEMMADDIKKSKNLQIFKDEEGLLRIRTKLILSDEPADFVCPIFLPGKHLIIKRLVTSKHHMLHHAGPGILMTVLRETYWITGVRRLVSSTVSKCVTCKRQSVKHADTPLPPLPLDRIKPAAAFEVTGIDLAGPLFLRSEGRRGRVNTIYTDNGTNFHGADNLLKALNWEEIAAYSSVRSIKWKFNPPAAPWWGGWWERLIRSLKELLRRNLGQKTAIKYLHKLRGDLRERFRNEYLGMLIQKGKERDSNIKVGDVVLVETDAKRIKWPLGVILEVYTGKDGNARVAKYAQPTASTPGHIKRLYPLEVQPDEVL
ncbi:uncharacterized protein [Choristoneura fumiferana]|uniref:uncharacterized protein n=1 Tax=Choristoneura fumiferana TaxID=7141 RepID=UPI003D15B69B